MRNDCKWQRICFLIAVFVCSCAKPQPPKSGYQIVSSIQVPPRRQVKLELPAFEPNDAIIVHIGYIVCYNEQRLIPNWVAWELTSDEVMGDTPKKTGYYNDPEWTGKQAENGDYRNSGYSHGHMAPAGDMKWSEQAMSESNYLTNICPQTATLNNGSWKSLEEKCRKLAQKYGKVWIACGPIVTKDNNLQKIGANGVVVPSRFFKVLLTQKNEQFEGVGFIFDNNENNQKYYNLAMSINEVESITGLDFFYLLPDSIEREVEKTYHWSIWQ